jgi:formylglycine-generating enzyme required for sulfatase activity
MKRPIILGISLLLAGMASMTPARVQAASMAVLVVGLETDAASDVFAASIKYEYTQKGYTMANDAVVLAKQTELRNLYKQNQPVDTTGLAAWGKLNSIDFVQLVVEKGSDITISGREQVAQVVTCGTTKYTGRSYYRMRFAAQGSMPCECEYECEENVCEETLNAELVKNALEMVYVTGGVFQMLRSSSYYVQLSDFYIGKYEVTQGLWKKVMGSNPSNFSGDSLPVEEISWEDINGANGFLAKLNAMTGRNYRLPTDAEWEYAARGCKAGVCDSYTYSGSNTLGDVAWYTSNSSSTTHAVGTKAANGLGLYDMSGNVFEWCYDWYANKYPSNTSSTPAVNPTGANSGSYRVLRGGSWVNLGGGTIAYDINTFNYGSPSDRFNFFGFRLV